MDNLDLFCKNCGEPLVYSSAKNRIIRCKHCSCELVLSKEDAPESVKLYLHDGQKALDIGSFDEAFTCFDKALEIEPDEPEGYFGRFQAKHKILYLKDEVNSRLQPIIFKLDKKNLFEDSDYLKALSLSNDEQKEVYRKRVEEINHIKSSFMELESNNVDYDCFICVKVTDETTGSKTTDYKVADDIYFALRGKGYRPFFSERELAKRTGSDYEALILYALMKSESMLLVCSNEEYLHTKWVKNEYSRFLHLINNQEKDQDAITIIFDGEPIENIPGKKGKVQGININAFTASEQIENFVHTHSKRGKLEKKILLEQDESERKKLEELKRKENEEIKARIELLEKENESQRAKENEQLKLQLQEQSELLKSIKLDQIKAQRKESYMDSHSFDESLSSTISCSNCGEPFTKELKANFFICPHCSSNNIIKKDLFNTKDSRLLEEAQFNLINYKFKEADDMFSSLIMSTEDNNIKCACLWGRLLAYFGIVDVKSYKEKKYTPTFSRFRSNVTILDCDYYKEIESIDADDEVKNKYIKKAKELNKIYCMIKDDLEATPDYDVFMCVKISAATREDPNNDSYSDDYDKAKALYDKLTRECGLKVFFSDKALSGIEYDSQIYSALAKSKSFLVMSSKKSYLESVWVQSEWRRWLNFIDSNLKDRRSFFLYVLEEKKEVSLPWALEEKFVQRFKKEDKLIESIYKFLDDYSFSIIKSDEETKLCPYCGLEMKYSLRVCPKCFKEYVIIRDEKRIKLPNYNSAKELEKKINRKDFEIQDDTLIRYKGKSKEVVIPSEVRIIDRRAFYKNKKIEAIYMSSEVDCIEEEAFSDCINLSTIFIPSSVKVIGSKAFQNCTNLKLIKISSRTKKIQDGTFLNCTNLRTVIIDRHLELIEGESFHRCEKLDKSKNGKIFFNGSELDFKKIQKNFYRNEYFSNAEILYYSEEPIFNHWKYDQDGNIIYWEE